jgi:hypothetical protein
MTKANLWTPGILALFALSLFWIMPATAAHHEQAAAAVKNVYVCGCGPTAQCDRISDQPGNAPCGKPLIEKQVLKEDADKVYVCACPDGCKCGLNQADPTKCACGKELRAYPKASKFDCAHGMKPGGGCDKPCAQQATAGCDKPCAPGAKAGGDKPCNKQPVTESNKPCCAKPAAAN